MFKELEISEYVVRIANLIRAIWSLEAVKNLSNEGRKDNLKELEIG